MSLAVSSTSRVIKCCLLLDDPTCLGVQFDTGTLSILHLMCFSAHCAHANRAFIFSHLQELECFPHSSQILSRSSSSSSSGSYLPFPKSETKFPVPTPSMSTHRAFLASFFFHNIWNRSGFDKSKRRMMNSLPTAFSGSFP